jgi:hypothetical protein
MEKDFGSDGRLGLAALILTINACHAAHVWRSVAKFVTGTMVCVAIVFPFF